MRKEIKDYLENQFEELKHEPFEYAEAILKQEDDVEAVFEIECDDELSQVRDLQDDFLSGLDRLENLRINVEYSDEGVDVIIDGLLFWCLFDPSGRWSWVEDSNFCISKDIARIFFPKAKSNEAELFFEEVLLSARP